MPSLSQIRTELLQQHQGLRALLEVTRAAAERCRRGEPAHSELSQSIARLAESLHHHNQREDELLRGIIPTIDAWGAVRAEAMTEAHVLEHFEVHAELVEAGRGKDPIAAAAAAVRLVEQISAHMAREEKDFLGPDLLNDHGGPVDGFGG